MSIATLKTEPSISQINAATEYLKKLYSSCDSGYFVLLEKTKTKVLQAFPHPVDWAKAAMLIARNPDCFLKVNPIDFDKALRRSQFAVGGEDEVCSIVSIHADVDANKGDKYPSQEEVLKALASMPLPPSLIVGSNGDVGGYHVYWLLMCPVDISIDEELKSRCKSISERWQNLLREKILAIRLDTELDKTFDLCRVLRPVGSKRQKTGNIVSIIEQSDHRYALSDFEKHLPAELPTPKEEPKVRSTDRAITEYLDRCGITVASLLSANNFERMRDGKWRRPNSESKEHSVVEFKVDNIPGVTVHSSAVAGLTAMDWYSRERLWVTWEHEGDWKAAARYAHEQIDSWDKQNSEPLEKTPPNGDNPKNSRENGGYHHKRSGEIRKSTIPDLQEYVPFPVNILPKSMGEYVSQVAAATGCDEAIAALPLLAGLASAIGNSRVLKIKETWKVPSILWCVVIAESGSVKSAPARMALKSLHSLQKRKLREYSELEKEYQQLLKIYERDLANFRKSKDRSEEPPTPPSIPICERVVVDDVTIEALGKRLSENPRGLLCAKDELSGWFESFDRYSKGKGDEAKWIEFYGGVQSVIDRSSAPHPIVVDRAAVSVTGTIQPGILRNVLTNERKQSGLAARLLFCMPASKTRKWTEDEVDQSLEAEITGIFNKLLGLEMVENSYGDLEPVEVCLSHEAKRLFINYFNRHNQEAQQLTGDLRAAFSKLEEVAARLALVFHCITSPSQSDELSIDSMGIGIQLCEWFKAEARRVYSVLAESEESALSREILRWIAQQTEFVTAYQVHRQFRGSCPSTEDAEKLLGKFVQSELGRWVDIPSAETGGRPTRGFTLRVYGDNPQNP